MKIIVPVPRFKISVVKYCVKTKKASAAEILTFNSTSLSLPYGTVVTTDRSFKIRNYSI
jgi:hypothetical protein